MILLTEGKRDNELRRFLPLFDEREIPMNVSKLKQILLAKFVNEARIRNLSLPSNLYLLGVARYYFQGNLTNNTMHIDDLGIFNNCADDFNLDVCRKLNVVIGCLREEYIDNYYEGVSQNSLGEDFGVSINELFNLYGNELDNASYDDMNDDTDKQYDANDVSAGSNYTFDIMYNQRDCEQYNEATEPGAWCITYGQQHYDGYIKNFQEYGGIHYVVFKRNDYEKVPRRVGKGYPRDEYGSSLICVLQRNDCPEPTYITSRWNHGGYDSPRCEADHAFSKEEFLNVIGCDDSILQKIYSIWKANRTDEDTTIITKRLVQSYKYAQMLLDGGTNPTEIFGQNILAIEDDGKKFSKGIYQVSIDDGKTWCIATKGHLLCNEHQISLGKFEDYTSSDMPLFLRCYGAQEDDGGIVIVINKKFNCYVDADGVETSQINYSKNTIKSFIQNNNFEILFNSRNGTYLFYNPLKNKYFHLPNGETEFREYYDVNVGDTRKDTRMKEEAQLICFRYHGMGGDEYFYYDMQANSFTDYNKFLGDYKINFAYKNFLGVEQKFTYGTNYIIDKNNRNTYYEICGNNRFRFIYYCGYGIIFIGIDYDADGNHSNGFALYDLNMGKEILDDNNRPICSEGRHTLYGNNVIVLFGYGQDMVCLYDVLHHQFIRNNQGKIWWEYYYIPKLKQEGIEIDDVLIPYPNNIQAEILQNFKRLI